MAEELVMPRLSDTMERGTIARWLKQEGDAVANGDVLAEIETDKALMELQAYEDGVLLKILVGDGDGGAEDEQGAADETAAGSASAAASPPPAAPSVSSPCSPTMAMGAPSSALSPSPTRIFRSTPSS